jgi:hypothetical protein
MTLGNGRDPVKIILCAGHECGEREGCARYRVRGGEFGWASFDLERKLPQYEGRPCPAHIEIRVRKGK